MNWYKKAQLNPRLRKIQLENAAKKEFGETWDIGHAGFLLTDGTMLNFSPSGMQRDLDHRSVSGLEGIKQQYTQGMYEFMNDTGAIRINAHPGSLGIHVMSTPTAEQMNVLAKNFKHFKEFFMDIQDQNGAIVDHREFNNPANLNVRSLLMNIQDAYTEDPASDYKYPAEIYRAYNTFYGSHTVPEDIDTMRDGEVMGAASMALPGGRDEFRELFTNTYIIDRFAIYRIKLIC